MGKQTQVKQSRYGLGEPLTSRLHKRPLKPRRSEIRKSSDPDVPRSLVDVVLEKGKAKEDVTRINFAPDRKPSASRVRVRALPLPPKTFRIIAGSYEKLLYGIEVSFFSKSPASQNDSPDDTHDASSSAWSPTPTFKPIFIFPAHIGCVKAVAASPGSGRWLSTGSSADEIVKVWDLHRLKEVGGLMQHEGSITYLTFPSSSHLVTCSEDGTIALFRTKDWAVLRVFKGHIGRVNSIAVHPTGRVALSVGKDRTIRMWDFMRGKGSGSTKIYKEGELIRWSTIGDCFAVQSLSTVDIYSTNMELQSRIDHGSRIHDILFVRPSGSARDILLVAAEDKKVTAYHREKGDASSLAAASGSDIGAQKYRVVAHFCGHENRVKAIATLEISLLDGSTATCIISISSDGKINIYMIANSLDLLSGSPPDISPCGIYDTQGTRLTSLAVAGRGDNTVASPRKRSSEMNLDSSTSSDQDSDVNKSDRIGEWQGFGKEQAMMM